MLTGMAAPSPTASPQPLAGSSAPRPGLTLRSRILAFVIALVVLSLLGSTLSLYRITEVDRLLDTINRVSVPMGRLFTQMQSDAEVFGRELERGLGHSHWNDPHWRPRPTPRWIEDLLENEVVRVTEMIRADSGWATPETRARWAEWASSVALGLRSLREDAAKLYTALEQKDAAKAAEIYPRWNSALEEWRTQVKWGASEYERTLRQTFTLAETRAAELRTGLEIMLSVVILMSFLLLWLGERALRPLGELTKLAREITRRGLRKADKSLLPTLPLTRDDEVSTLAREFHHMATALLEREKTVEAQKDRLLENNRLLKEIGVLNENILNSIESVLIVIDLNGKITQCNPTASAWLGESSDKIIGTGVVFWPKLRGFFPLGSFLPPLQGRSVEGVASKAPPTWLESSRLEPRPIQKTTAEGTVTAIMGGYLMPLKQGEGGASGAIIVLHDLTEEKHLQDRLSRAENLAAVGRMSAQVAHEVRNPLHSIGLEAEVAVELAARLGHSGLKQSLQSILSSVDRLEKITENYLKLSRLSAGQKSGFDLGEVLEAVLATYAPACEAMGAQVDWRREPGAQLAVYGDRDLMEQVLGNLLRNALQALEGWTADSPPWIRWALGNAESGSVWLTIEDNGPGIAADIKDRLFTPFLTTRAQGTGLGLSFVKQVIEDHGGKVRVRDRQVGEGACFEITLPPAPQSTVALQPVSVVEIGHP